MTTNDADVATTLTLFGPLTVINSLGQQQEGLYLKCLYIYNVGFFRIHFYYLFFLFFFLIDIRRRRRQVFTNSLTSTSVSRRCAKDVCEEAWHKTYLYIYNIYFS